MQAVTQIGQFFRSKEEAPPFKRHVVGWIVVILNVLAALNSTYFFLGQILAHRAG